MRTLLVALASAAALAAAGVAAADTGSATTAGGTTVADGVATLTSNLADTQTANDASSITFALPAGTTFAQLKTLSADYDITAGGCGSGSPRFSVTLADGKNLFAYLGPAPSFNTCTLNTWQSSGNLIGNDTSGVWDTSQELAGTQVSTYSAALAALGKMPVTSVSFVVDAGGSFPGKVQTVLAKNVTVNDMVFPKQSGKSGQSPAQLCKAELAATGKTAFEAKYGKNHNLKNAFGKCVSAQAKAKHAATTSSTTSKSSQSQHSSHGSSTAAAKRHHGR